jgi:Abortive infection alpha
MSDEPLVDADIVRAAPGLVRMAAGLPWRMARWGVVASVHTGSRLARAAVNPAYTAQVAEDVGHELRQYARDLLGVTELDARVTELMPAGTEHDEARLNGHRPVPEVLGLRAQGARLLAAAAEIETGDAVHPAYARILTELAPDEGRILRLLATEGAQASVDVRASNLIGVGSAMIASGLSMIGAEAGCQHRERVPAYLNNLERLGLVWFSREPIGVNAAAYQVLEAQPDVLDAIKRASRAKTVQRSIDLTPFGQDFCRVCLPLDYAEVEELTEADLVD